MKKSSTILAVAFVIEAATTTFASENQKPDENNRIELKILSIQGYWPIRNSSSDNADVITSPFGPRALTSDGYDFHEGIDIKADFVPVYAAFSGIVWEVNSHSENYSDNTVERWVLLRHIDPEDPGDPNDDTEFYTWYNHLQWYPQLEDLEDLERNEDAVIDAGTISDTYTDPNTNYFYVINPFATSGNSGVPDKNGNKGQGPPHLHFEGLVGGIDFEDNAINPMRKDSLPYYNGPHPFDDFPGAWPRIENVNVDLSTNPRRISFRLITHYQELDLDRIILTHGIDRVETNFDTRENTDADPNASANNRNQDGTIQTTTAYGSSITIRIKTHDFDPDLENVQDRHQKMDFEYDLPSDWYGPYFTVEAVDTQNKTTSPLIISPTGVEDYSESLIPAEYHLSQNFPNPFNPSTAIRFALPKKSLVSLAVFNVRGSLVRELVTQKSYDPGWGELVWDGTNASGLPVASGAYFYRLTAESLDNGKKFSQTKKLILVR